MKGESACESVVDTLSREGSIWLESAFCKGHPGGALLFSEPVEVVTLCSLSGLELFFRKLEEKIAEGFFLAGWLSYEAGYGFEEKLVNANVSDDNTSLSSLFGWFGVYREPERFSMVQVEKLFAEEKSFFPDISDVLSELSFNFSEASYGRKIQTIKEHIAAGNLYQVNFTGRYRFPFKGPVPALFSALRGAQPSSYSACINKCGTTILSFSPELFFRRHGSVIETMPMKGTAPRGISAEEDCRLREGLVQCSKNLAENLMIVDLLRNDLGRICKPGSVETGELFAIESWPTLHQMVSTIRGEQREDVGLYDLFRALFPSGSITGAPKINAMNLIQSLEEEPRGVYTGTIGYITPESDMVFSVAIRTIELSGNEGIYGSGGGIVWDSEPEEEYRECQLKAKILSSGGSVVLGYDPDEKYRDPWLKTTNITNTIGKPVDLFESILWCGSYLWLDEHLERLASSASTLGFPFDRTAATLMLNCLEEELRRSDNRFKVRLTLTFQGVFSTSHELITVQRSDAPLRLCIAGHSTSSADQLLSHKTTARVLYDRYFTLARLKGYDEVIFLNERGEVSEGAVSNIFVPQGRQLITPPLQSGLLNGIFRSYMLSTRIFVSEKNITLCDLPPSGTIYIANSVRGLRPAIFTGHQIHLQDL
ncbi:MAG: aminodeoxychorismate synthase component I [Chlorobiaceae bacterium]|nr:aminodeoxychorismate synthase component I [Chlorobiaceae bacterium]NTV16128.1 aminodeoxychorismate synthase component I [Chlorobiaceae bacterium]